MITFKQHLQEYTKEKLTHLADRYDVDDAVFSIIPYIPLSSSIFKRLNEVERIKVFHVCSIDNVYKLKKIEGTKKSISGFSAAGRGSIIGGIEGGRGTVVLVEGDKIVKGNRDLYTTVDEQGRRWYKALRHTVGDKMMNELNDLKEYLSETIYNVSPRTLYSGNDIFGGYTQQDLSDFSEKPDNYNKDKKRKAKYIKSYIDGVEKILKNNLETFKYNLHPKERGATIGINEIVVNNIKILKVYLVEEALTDQGYNSIAIKKEYNDLKYNFPTQYVKNVSTLQKLIKVIKKRQ